MSYLSDWHVSEAITRRFSTTVVFAQSGALPVHIVTSYEMCGCMQHRPAVSITILAFNNADVWGMAILACFDLQEFHDRWLACHYITVDQLDPVRR